MVWLRAWPQRKGWKVGEVAVCSSRRDGGGWVGGPVATRGQPQPAHETTGGGVSGPCRVREGRAADPGEKEAPLLTKVQPLSAHQACLFRGVPKQEQPLGTWPLLSPTFISVTGAGGEWGPLAGVSV